MCVIKGMFHKCDNSDIIGELMSYNSNFLQNAIIIGSNYCSITFCHCHEKSVIQHPNWLSFMLGVRCHQSAPTMSVKFMLVVFDKLF